MHRRRVRLGRAVYGQQRQSRHRDRGAQELGDELPVSWRHRSERYAEKLATPDTSVADLIGDVDPIKVAEGRSLGDPETIHYGLVPRSNGGIDARGRAVKHALPKHRAVEDRAIVGFRIERTNQGDPQGGRGPESASRRKRGTCLNRDGTELTQITRDLGGANWAPFFAPDGKRIIFATNFKNPRGPNFDLYLINVDGTGLEQVTFSETFDGFPMFSPDGTKLVFASNRNSTKETDTNLFIADWVW